MEKKNTVLLTIVAIATLLIAIVGATFAYFTATTKIGGTDLGEGVSNVSTARVSGARLDLNPIAPVIYLSYPNGFAYTGISAKAEKQDPTNDPNQYAVSYKIDLKFSNNTKSNISWNLYKSNVEINNQKTCNLKTVPDTVNPATTRYFYECAGTNNYGTLVPTGTGTILPNEVDKVITVSDIQTIKTTDATPVYYYLVVDYPDSGDATQDRDQGTTISAAITGVSNLSAVAD